MAELLGGTPFLGFIAAVAFATILAVVAGPDARRRERALARHLRRTSSAAARRPSTSRSASRASPRSCSASLAVAPGHRLQGTERRVHGRPGVCDRLQRELSAAAALDRLEAVHDRRRRQLDRHGRGAVGAAHRAQPDGLGRPLPQRRRRSSRCATPPSSRCRRRSSSGSSPRSSRASRPRRRCSTTRRSGRIWGWGRSRTADHGHRGSAATDNTNITDNTDRSRGRTAADTADYRGFGRNSTATTRRAPPGRVVLPPGDVDAIGWRARRRSRGRRAGPRGG